MKLALLITALIACTGASKPANRPSPPPDSVMAPTTDTSPAVTADSAVAVEHSDSVARPADTAVAPQGNAPAVEQLCLFIKMPNGKIRLLAQQSGVKTCQAMYKTFPDSVRASSDSGLARKTSKAKGILLTDFQSGWQAGRDSVPKKIQLY